MNQLLAIAYRDGKLNWLVYLYFFGLSVLALTPLDSSSFLPSMTLVIWGVIAGAQIKALRQALGHSQSFHLPQFKHYQWLYSFGVCAICWGIQTFTGNGLEWRNVALLLIMPVLMFHALGKTNLILSVLWIIGLLSFIMVLIFIPQPIITFARISSQLRQHLSHPAEILLQLMLVASTLGLLALHYRLYMRPGAIQPALLGLGWRKWNLSAISRDIVLGSDPNIANKLLGRVLAICGKLLSPFGNSPAPDLIEKGLFGQRNNNSALLSEKAVIIIASATLLAVWLRWSIAGELNSEAWGMTMGLVFVISCFLLQYFLLLEFINARASVIQLRWLSQLSYTEFMTQLGRLFYLRVMKHLVFLLLALSVFTLITTPSWRDLDLMAIIICSVLCCMPLLTGLNLLVADKLPNTVTFRFSWLLIQLIIFAAGIRAQISFKWEASLLVTIGGFAMMWFAFQRWQQSKLDLASVNK